MRQPVRRRVARGVVERDRPRGETLDGSEQRRLDALVVADDVVATRLLDARRVEAADDRDPFAGCRDEKGALPRAVHPGDEVEAGVARQRRLTNEGQPEVDVLLAENAGRLLELLLDEGGGGGHGGARYQCRSSALDDELEAVVARNRHLHRAKHAAKARTRSRILLRPGTAVDRGAGTTEACVPGRRSEGLTRRRARGTPPCPCTRGDVTCRGRILRHACGSTRPRSS